MSQLLDQAVAALKKLPELDQDAIASLILDEIEKDRRWKERGAKSSDQLNSPAPWANDPLRAKPRS